MENRSQILVVDDDREIRELLGKFLTHHGCRITTAADGRAMFERLTEWCIVPDTYTYQFKAASSRGTRSARYPRHGRWLPGAQCRWRIFFQTSVGASRTKRTNSCAYSIKRMARCSTSRSQATGRS